MNTHERNLKGKWKEHDRKWMQHERNMHANERNMTGNECNMKGICMQMKGTWQEMNATWKEYACKWMLNERNMLPKHLKPKNNSWIHFRACLGMDLGFMLDLEYADFHKTLESHRAPPKSDNHNINSNYSHVKDVDGSSYGCGSKWKTDVGPQMWKSSLVLNIQFNWGT